MKSRRGFKAGLIIGASSAVVVVALLAFGVIQTNPAGAAGGQVKSPNEVAPDRYIYYPGTEVLAKDEIRLITCGSGLPAPGEEEQDLESQ